MHAAVTFEQLFFPNVKFITRTIWILALISLFTDAASEMLYPVMPIYLKDIGFSVLMIGVLEGVAEAVVGLSKVYFGALSDRLGRRLPFVQLGYAMSAFSKPFLAYIAQPLWVFSMRDAMLAEESGREHRATVFGFHRSMDTLGAVLGPAVALVYLYFNPGSYEALFFFAFIPGFLAIIFSLALREKQRYEKRKGKSRTFFSFVRYWKRSTPEFKSTLIGLLLFALFNSSDMFLLLRARESGMSDAMVVGVYIFYNLIYAIFAYPFGIFADRKGLKWVFIIGLAFFSITYIGLSYTEDTKIIWLLFGIYGLFAAATEGIGKAWISIVAGGKDTATALGTYATFQSLGALGAAIITGWLWTSKGFADALLFSGGGAFVAIIYFLLILPNSKRRLKSSE
jgi:MFS family permease